MKSHSATIELGVLLRQYQLELVQITSIGDAEVASAPVQWVHSSDLLDPTPFLTPRTVLLTTGAQFSRDTESRSEQRSYVQRLVAAGVCALGFAVNFTYTRIPEGIIAACQELGLPLFRVPYSTPFIAISQTAARLLDRESHARDSWASAAQRSIALAALQAGGLDSVIRELARQLSSDVILFDEFGRVVATSNQSITPTDSLVEQVTSLVRSQTRATKLFSNGGSTFALQTIGRRANLLGVLATSDNDQLDYAAQSVIGIAIALASTALEQARAASGPVESVRRVIIELLRAGQFELANRIAAESLGPLPEEPISIAVFTGQIAGVEHELSRRGFCARIVGRSGEDELLVIESAASGTVSSYSRLVHTNTNLELNAGLSAVHSYEHLTLAIEQAELAAEAAGIRDKTGAAVFDSSLNRGILTVIEESDEAKLRADALISPIADVDDRNNEQLVESLAVWLQHNGQFAPAAESLGVHRHTLKTRMGRVSQILGRDLNTMDARAELWAALRIRNEV